MEPAGIITAMVTPFDADGGLDESACAALMRHLLAHGSDALVLAGTTGESATLSDDEKVRLWELGVEVCGADRVIAGTGSNDTRHTIELTERAAGAGVGAALVVAPYYNRPNRRGVVAHFEAVAAATDLPIVLYNVPPRTGIDMPNDLLAELAQLETVRAVKQARNEDLAPIDGLALLAGNDEILGPVLDMGGPGGILVASHVAGEAMRRMIDEPGERAALQERLIPLYEALSVAPPVVCVKAALSLLGHDVGGVRLPMVEASPDERERIAAALEAQGLLERV